VGVLVGLDKTVCYNYNVIMNELAFEWDELKSSTNKQKHRNAIGKGGENEERI
jgi:hypothetical protein